MLEIKANDNIESIVVEKEQMIEKCKDELRLLSKAQRTAKWVDGLLDNIRQLRQSGENVDTLKELISDTWLIYDHVEGLIAFDAGWLTNIEITVVSLRKQIVPKTFHNWLSHNSYNHLYSVYRDDTKIKKINIIVNAVESINAWCMHRLYVLDENPRFYR